VKKFLFILIISLIPFFQLFAVDFNGLTVSSDDRLLFGAEFEGQNALYISRLSDRAIQQLTAYPEKLYIVESGRTIIALSHFGAMRIATSGGLPSAVRGYPSFSTGSTPLRGRLNDLAASPDGRWILHIEPVTPGFGTLILTNALTGEKKTISERIELQATDFPAKWSPDSRLFVYAKGGRLFYFPILSNISVLIDERFRMMGSGGITSVLWGAQGEFYYFTGNTLYRITNPELFTRTVYGDFLSVGNVVAAIPMEFEPGFDRYWIAPNASSILINKGSKGFFLFPLSESRNTTAVLPHILIPYGAENFNVFWTFPGSLTICYTMRGETSVLRFEVNGHSIRSLNAANTPSSPNGSLSPDGTRVIFWGENGLELWDYNEWHLIQRLTREPVFSCAWLNSRQFITGNSRFIEEVDISSSSYPRRRICLSSAAEFGFEESVRGPTRILAKAGTEWFSSDGVSAWTPVTNAQLRQTTLSSERYRVFLDPQPSGHYKNIPMIRSMQSTGTLSLLANHTAGGSYALGRQMQVALCFDLYDDDTGLPLVLSALRRFNIKATFFLNGNFIRRHPDAASAIVNAGHEMGSLFYAPIDLSDTRYRITREFIAQGLARNEDEFNRITGRELSIIWHPPFFRSSNLVNTSAAAEGYITVPRTYDPGDWMSREDSFRLSLRQVSPSEMIDQIIARRQAGAIIPVRLGLLQGGRDEYLFQRIEALLDALIRSGCEIVTVSTVLR
jgi:peptidoglycan/xylan/chitin deacetylase (PgdA/CDA1 family)